MEISDIPALAQGACHAAERKALAQSPAARTAWESIAVAILADIERIVAANVAYHIEQERS